MGFLLKFLGLNPEDKMVFTQLSDVTLKIKSIDPTPEKKNTFNT